MQRTDTSLEILTAARDLFSLKGYNATTTKEIAKEAGVNEVTIFRKFQSKQKLFEAVFEQFNYKPNISIDLNDYKNKPQDFLTDLGKSLYNLFQSNLSLIKIEFRNQALLDESVLPLQKFANEIKNMIIKYFSDNRFLSNDEIEQLSVNFMSAIFGLFININILHTFEPPPDFEQCLASLVDRLVQ